MNILGQLFRNQRGVTSIEYALIALLIAVVIIAGASTLGTNLGGALVAINGMIPAP